MFAVCILLGNKPDWDTAQGLLGKTSFLKTLIDYNCSNDRVTTKMLRLLVLVTLVALTQAAWGHNKVTTAFDDEVKKHVIGSSKKSYAMRKAKKANKPLLVILTRKGCGACQNLKQSVNMETGEKGIKRCASELRFSCACASLSSLCRTPVCWTSFS